MRFPILTSSAGCCLTRRRSRPCWAVAARPRSRSANAGVIKRLLLEAVRTAGVTPPLGGIEYTEELVNAMDLR